VDSLRPRLDTKSIRVYPVDYPASMEFSTAVAGIHDASERIRSMAATCPDTKMVLGGYSQGAAVMGFVTANVIPDGAPEGVPNPMPPDVADHVAAVALIGKPNPRFMRAINEPLIEIGPLYADKTIELCVPDDPVCSSGRDLSAHTPLQYEQTGIVGQAATFAAGRLQDLDRAGSEPDCATAPTCGPVEHLAGGQTPG
jgi:cutinase